MTPRKPALDLLDFVNASPTPYHAVATAADLLTKAGFAKILERQDWNSEIKPGGKYFLTRNASSIVAFAVGNYWRPGNPVAMIGAHTDSPCLRIKPVSKKSGGSGGYMQVGVETYGGGIWHSWFDRDLGCAGRVMVQDGDEIKPKLVRVDKPILRIPHLAIHLHRNPDFNPNKETEMFPIAGLAAAELNKTSAETKGEEETGKFNPLKSLTERHHPRLVELVAEQVDAEPDQIVDFELILYDTHKSCLGGLNDEFILSARLDNLCMTYCSVAGLIASVRDESSLDTEPTVRMIACFDHEEIGSTSAQGADSNLLPAVLRRLCALDNAGATTAFEQTLSASFLISADMAHAVHPNYEAKYEVRHVPALNAGPVVKINANQRYATDTPGIVLIQEAARLAAHSKGVPLQLFVVRNDSPCGSTIGPMLSARLGVRTLDLGNPQLSMHSIREMAGAQDVGHAISLFASFFERYGQLAPRISVD